MDGDNISARLSRMSTCWSQLFEAHQGQSSEKAVAQQALMQRYGGAVYRYLLAMVRDADVADDLAQDFAVRFLRGDFCRVHPERGRFRDFVKTSLRHLVIDYRRRQQARPKPMALDDAAPTADRDDGYDRDFAESWRKELLDRAWEQLARHERETGQPFHSVLRLKVDHPDLRSAQLAERMTNHGTKPVSADWVRKNLERARRQFAHFLVDDVAHSLDEPTSQSLEEELVELGLLEYCRPALERYRQNS